MTTTMTALEIGNQWLAYVNDIFMLENGCIRPEVEEEYRRLESAGAIAGERELWRSHTDTLIDNILSCTSRESRQQLITNTDRRSLAYLQDRIQCGTEVLIAFAQKGLQINIGESVSLAEYFRLMLIQKQS